MATILRSSKYFRYFASIGRNLVFNSSRGEIQQTVIPQKQCLNCALPRCFATQIAASHTSNDSNLERNLKRLDHNVRRTGRISKRDLEDILDELRHSGSATSTQSLHIIRCCGNLIPEESPEIRTYLVDEIWKTLDNIGVPMDISHYNALLRVYLENEHSFSPTDFLTNLEHKGLEPNRVTYQRLIARYCQEGDIEGATRILEFMREKQLPVNENVFNALIMGHSQADDMESAVGIVGVMQQAGLEPSAETYTALLCGYAKKGDLEAIESTLQECEKRDIDLLDRDYMNVIFALAVNNNVEHVDRIIEKMRQGAGYNQDAVNLILRLVNIGQEDLGYKIFLTMPHPVQGEKEQNNLGVFFIHQLVKANRPLEKILSICEKLEKDDFNPRALLIAAESSLQCGSIEQAYGLLQAMSDRNFPIRQHYFWPLLAKYSKESDSLLNILSQMCIQFKLNVGGETLRDYIIPGLETKSSNEIISLLRTSGVSPAAAASAIVAYHLAKNDIVSAAKVARQFNAHYSPAILRKPLVQAYIHTEDRDSFITILRQIHDNMDRTLPTDDDSPVSIPDRLEIIGQFVFDVAAASQKNRIMRVEAILQGLLDQGLGLSNSAAERLQDKLGEELTDKVSNLLGKLTSGELVPVKVSRPAVPTSIKMDETQLMRVQNSLEEKGLSTVTVKKQLLSLYCRNKELEKAEQLVKELEENGFVFTGIMYSQLLDLYLNFENLDETQKVLQKLQEKEPDFLLDNAKIIRVATLLVKNDRLSDAVQFLSEQAKERQLEDRSFQFSSLCFRLLNSLAEKGKTSELKEMFDILVKHGYIDVNNILLGPLIKVHIVRNDLASALEQFEWCCQNYRVTPWKSELARKFIQAEDPTSLQRLTDLSIQIHGEVNSLYDLVFAFVECGRIRQAHKILETPGLRSRPHRINSACERYQQEGLVEPLEGLVEATRDISHIDRLDIYYHLLLSYCKSGDPDKALGLWTRMQEENVQPSDEFLSTLGKFLIEKGKNVPFVMPEIELSTNTAKSAEASQEKGTSTSSKLRQSLRQDKLDVGLDIRQKAVDDGEELTITDLSLLIESLVKANRYGEASKLMQEILAKGLHPVPRVIRFFLNRLAEAGDVDTMSLIGNQLSSDMKKFISYDNRFCHANVIAGKASEYLKKLSEDIENADESNLKSVSERFPRGGVIGILQKHPELHSEYEKLALKYAAKGLVGPINVLWMHYFVSGKDDAAEELWNKYLSDSPRVMFQYILQEARERKDDSIPQKLIKLLKDTSVSEGARGNAYSCLIDVLVYKEKSDEALGVLKEAVEDVCLEHLNRSALVRLKKSVELQGKTFPYEVPAKSAKGSSSSSSSSSSSDDEPTKKTVQ